MHPTNLVKLLIALTLVAAVFALPSVGATQAAGDNSTAVRDWNLTATKVIAAEKQNSVMATRSMAMVHVAIYDAIEAIDTGSVPQGYRLNGSLLNGVPAGASRESATAAAARIVLLDLFPGRRSDIDAAYSASLSQLPDDAAQAEGVLVGQWVGLRILAWRSQDGSTLTGDYAQPLNAGIYQPIAPATAAFTRWNSEALFVLRSASQFRCPPPPALTSAQYAVDYNEVKSLGSVDSTARTPEQTQIALFWVDADWYMWNTVARTVAAQKQTTIEQDARLFAEMNVAIHDSLVANFDNKYTYNFWRPENAIHAGNTDGNPDTVGDPTWTPLQPTPAFPDYPSAHTSNGAAASSVLASFFGTDAIGFSFTTRTSPGGAVRSFTSFSQAAEEEGVSRIYVGYHFRSAVNAALTLGRQVGDWTVRHFGPAVPATPSS